jgi:hypothetical protein
MSATTLMKLILEQVECAICLSTLCYPVTTTCGHSFCQACLKKWELSGQIHCPTCRAIYISTTELRQSIQLKKIIQLVGNVLPTETTITLVSNTGVEFKLERSSAIISQLVKNASDNFVTIPAAKTDILEEVVYWLKRHKGTSQWMPDFDDNFYSRVSRDSKKMLEISNLANLMGIPVLRGIGLFDFEEPTVPLTSLE